METNMTHDTEITLTRGSMRLVCAPYGASLRGLTRNGLPVVTGYTGAENKVGGQGDVLVPFPGRVRDGRYEFGGQTYQMERNDKETPSAIHGFLRHVVWETAAQDSESVTFQAAFGKDDYAGYPFALRATVTYQLTDNGMTCAFMVENVGDGPAPVGAGFHPYFSVGSETIDGDTLSVPFAATLEFDALLPTGNVLPVDGTEWDFRAPRPIGATVFNTCYLHPTRDADGLARIRLSNAQTGRAVTVTLDRAFDFVVLYSGDPLPAPHRRASLAIEPMTCGSDAFNHPEWGLAVLAPSQTLSGQWDVINE